MTVVNEPQASAAFLDLNRPQYVSVPEGFISSLAWKIYDWDHEKGDSGKNIALIFKSSQESKSRAFELVETQPEGNDAKKFSDSLKHHGVGPDHISAEKLAEAVVNSVTGIRAEKSTLQAASPITPGYALLQNMRGIQKANHPPDLAEILEQLYRLGIPRGELVQKDVASRWHHAATRRCMNDPLLAAMDKAARDILIGHGLRLSDAKPTAGTGVSLAQRSPYSWFVKAWNSITSDEWVDALPARIWVDWATTVLRLALGMGYLWEASWYEAAGRAVLGPDDFEWETFSASSPIVLPWKSSHSSEGVRDVASLLMWRVHKGAVVRKVLEPLLTDELELGSSFGSVMRRLQKDETVKRALTGALGSQKKAAPNTWEAIKYALLTRDNAGPYADYYGLLKRNGRFLTVQPGTEWIAVVASLSCGGPGRSTNVARLMSDLDEMGLAPELADLVQLLEKAGLARGSADADQGVTIKSAF